jgi:hypothetical protein
MYIKRNSEPITLHNTLDLEVSYDYYPAEREVLRDDDGGGIPSSPASVEISAIYFEGVDIKDVAQVYDAIYEDLEDEILAYELGE